MKKKANETKRGGDEIIKEQLITEEPLSEKDEQSRAIQRTAEIQDELTKKKRKRIVKKEIRQDN